MCGIIFARKNCVKELCQKLSDQSNRGLDSIGIIDLGNMNYYIKVSDKISLNEKLIDYISYIEQIKFKGNIILHHRKASVGSVNIENAHPYYFPENNFFILQNGTSIQFKNWLDINEIGTKSDDYTYYNKTDTRALGYLINKNPEKLKKYLELTIGVVVIVDIKTKKIFVYSDGEREISDLKYDEKIPLSSENKLFNDKHKGFIQLDFDFNMLSGDWDKVKEKVVTYYGYNETEYEWELPSTYGKPLSHLEKELNKYENNLQDEEEEDKLAWLDLEKESDIPTKIEYEKNLPSLFLVTKQINEIKKSKKVRSYLKKKLPTFYNKYQNVIESFINLNKYDKIIETYGNFLTLNTIKINDKNR